MRKEKRFWFGKTKSKVLEGKATIKEAHNCMAGIYTFSRVCLN